MEKLMQNFKELFGKEDGTCFFSPGRINLIGEHTDYNGGYVFPCAITLGTYGVVSKRTDKTFNVASVNFNSDIVTFTLDDLNVKVDGWANYIKGMLYYIQQQGYTLDSGFDLLVYGNLPNGAGLSSSASFELLIGLIAKNLYHLPIEPLELVKLGKVVENDYIGVNSGIMDQFAIGMGKENCAILLDCAQLNYNYVPVQLTDDHHAYKIVIMNTNKRRELADSKYNERFAQTRQALKELQQYANIQHLADLTNEQFEQLAHYLSNDILKRRAKHAVTENRRVLQATQLLKEGNLKAFGQLMNESHLSTQVDYEVTGVELDTLVHTAWQQEGVIGARMTGAGFGGCAIAIVQNDKIEAVTQAIEHAYVAKIGYKPSFYVAEIGNGTFSHYL